MTSKTTPALACDAPVSRLRGVGPKRREALEAAGVETVADLLRVVPRHYTDRRHPLPLTEERLAEAAEAESTVTVEGRLRGVRRIFTRRRGLTLVRGELVGEEGSLPCLWFNRPYLASTVDESRTVLLCGKMRRGRGGPELLNADLSDPEDGTRVIPHYAEIGGLGDKAVRRLVETALDRCVLADLDEGVPTEILDQRRLPRLADALRELHSPPEDVDAKALREARTDAHHRLIYGDLFQLQVDLARARRGIRSLRKGHQYRIDDQARELARSVLPFRLTGAQKRCLKEIVRDLEDPRPMLRLLQGDVGCGKTIVAAVASLLAAHSALQTAFLSPTEVLAEQLATELDSVLGAHHRVGLLTRSSGGGDEVREELAAGRIDVVCGTHALLQENVGFAALGLVVIDEQHRFGVGQRMAMIGKGSQPDLLLMTATPIPRSLALAAFGDLDLSTIDEMPAGRTPVATRTIDAAQRSAVLSEVEREIAAGGRVFVVFPRIEGGEEVDASLEGTGRLYRRRVGEGVEELTGRTPAAERAATLDRFRRGEVSVLLATTVIEVGVDVPQATLMVIEGAERFGLSQLHQLRGRVGRGQRAGRCIALHGGELSEEATHRLRTFADTTDGFALAEEDLRQRGPGDLLGLRQSGFGRWSPARLATAMSWLEAAREDARHWVAAEGKGVAAGPRSLTAG